MQQADGCRRCAALISEKIVFPSKVHRLSLAAACVAAFGSSLIADLARAEDLGSAVRSLLSNRCFQCHGPDEQERQAELRLDLASSAVAELPSGTRAVVPRRPDESELMRRVVSSDPDEQMPPPDAGPALSASEAALLRKWIADGAVFPGHWSYGEIHRPEAPAIHDAAGAAWAVNPIDQFVWERLQQAGKSPAEEADRHVLARRLSLDLTGLPPTWPEVEQFVDDQSADAVDRYVDRLLAKPTFGEHWARMWLDLARYADSAGYADDPPRTIWAFRDWVIRAFNDNMPFDQFTIEQLAGDLLPNPTDEQLTATAFHRNTMTNNEGGTNDEEFRNVAVVDRVNTTMAVWMGTTMACAQCHNHKYDPISQKEFFQFFAILNNTQDRDLRDEQPLLEVWTDQQQAQKAEWQEEIADLESKLDGIRRAAAGALSAWEESWQTTPVWRPMVPSKVVSEAGAEATLLDDGSVRVARKGTTDAYTLEFTLSRPIRLTALRLEALPDESLPGNGPGHAGGNFVITEVGVQSDSSVKLAEAFADYAQSEFDASHVIDQKTGGDRGWAIGGGTGKSHALSLVTEEPVELAAGAVLRIVISQKSPHQHHTLGRFRWLLSSDDRMGDYLRVPGDVAEALAKKRTDLDDDQIAARENYFFSIYPKSKILHARWTATREKLAAEKPHTTVPIFRQLTADKRRMTHIQLRGNFLNLGEEVAPGLPTAFQVQTSEEPVDRLAMARWLVDRRNPLTARVIANRYWEAVFGIGLVRTSEDFGSQGERPSHPALLDWLAAELIDSGWDTKALLRTVVTSATYRQSSAVKPKQFEADPDNRLLARGPRVRLSAEMIRDQALAVSGLLSGKRFGPPVRPPQPKLGLSAAFGSGVDWEPSQGEDRYRRGIYTTWRRSSPYPSMAAFDAPNREVCTVRRARTNTPLQALVTLNDPVYIEAAQVLGRMMADLGTSTADSVRAGFRRCLSREPKQQELHSLVELFEQVRRQLERTPKQAQSLATVPAGELPAGANAAEAAAWTVVANVLLNLDEMILKR